MNAKQIVDEGAESIEQEDVSPLLKNMRSHQKKLSMFVSTSQQQLSPVQVNSPLKKSISRDFKRSSTILSSNNLRKPSIKTQKDKNPHSQRLIPFSVHFQRSKFGSSQEKPGAFSGERDSPNHFYMIEEKLNLADFIFSSNDHGEHGQTGYLD